MSGSEAIELLSQVLTVDELAEAVAKRVVARLAVLPPDAREPATLVDTRDARPPVALLAAPEAARVLGITVAALRKRVQRGDLPRGCVVYHGRRYQFRRDRLVG
jgi:DNA-directed RNA polymerase specialized sigma24 family protein